MKNERTELNAVRVAASAKSAEALHPRIEAAAPPRLQPGQALVRVKSAAVNPSDVKAALGLMPQAVWPRTPGRDYAGVVVDGPAEWVGREVWGSGGDLGITRDGTHAGWLLLPVEALSEKPRALDFDAAGSVGVPFVTAYEGWRRAGLPQRGQVVAVFGANGKVGQAAVQLAAMAGAKVVAVQRSAVLQGHAATSVEVVDAREGDVAERVRAAAGGRGADLVFNTVGSAYFEATNRVMAKGATQIFISTTERAVPFDIFAFYRGMHTYVGVDTLAFDCVASNQRLEAMRGGFERGELQPFPVREGAAYGLDRASEAYRRVFGGDAERVVLRP